MSDLDPLSSVTDNLERVETKLIKVNPNQFANTELDYPVQLLKAGDVVAFPTETVYGLGANALSSQASKKIFQTKLRPADNPLIVHISTLDMLPRLVSSVPPEAHDLMKAFWPGPLTILFPKSNDVPDVVTCGQPTVAIRMPSHPIARKLIELSDVPIAAPSANLSGRPSPTRAEHVYADLNGRCKCIVDGGATEVGVESTVVDLTRKMILRPGGITQQQLSKYIPSITTFHLPAQKQEQQQQAEINSLLEKPPTPGLKYRHYSPKAKLYVLEETDNINNNNSNSSKMLNYILNNWERCKKSNTKMGIIHTHKKYFSFPVSMVNDPSVVIVELGSHDNPREVAHGLFGSLRDLDNQGVEEIIMEGISEADEGMAVMNRIRKAASELIKL